MRLGLKLMGLIFLLALAMPGQALKIVNLAEVEGKTFYPGDTVDLGIVLLNNESKQLNLTVEQYLSYAEINPIPLYENVVIGTGNNTMISDFSFDVSEYSKRGTYTHSVRVYEGESLAAEKTTTFSVGGTTQIFSDYNVVICSDSECNDVTSIFDAGKTVYINIESTQNPTIYGYVETPNGSLTNLQFTNGMAEFKPASAGAYEVNVILSKDGFAPDKIEKNITVIGSETVTNLYVPVGEFSFIAILAIVAVAVIILITWILFFKNKGK